MRWAAGTWRPESSASATPCASRPGSGRPGAGPGLRLWDLAYAMKGFVPLVSGGDPVADAPRLRALADGYGLSAGQRAELPPLIGTHTRGMADLLDNGARTGMQPWARLHAEGHGEHWTAT